MNEEYKENNYLELYNYLNQKKVMLGSYDIIKKINELTQLLEVFIREKCEHEYEYQRICYCKKCMFTF